MLGINFLILYIHIYSAKKQGCDKILP